jgi:hypothetical protein
VELILHYERLYAVVLFSLFLPSSCGTFNCLKHFKPLKHLMFIHYMFRSIRPSSGVKIVVRGSCCVLVFLMVVYCNLGSLPAFVVCLNVFFRVVYLSGTAC